MRVTPRRGSWCAEAWCFHTRWCPYWHRCPSELTPLVLRVPIERRLELDLIPAPGWEQEYHAPRRLEAQWGSVDEDLENEGGSFRSVLHVVLPSQTVATEDYPAFARFCQAVDELTTRPPRLRRASDQ